MRGIITDMFLFPTLIFFLILTLGLLFIITSSLIGFIITRVPFVPTYEGDIEFIVEKLGITPADVFYDLGSGNGKVAFLVEKLSGAAVTGFELTWWTYLFSKLKAKVGKSNARFINKNFFKQDWSEANFIYAYLFPPLMSRVEEKFLQNCKPGSIAVIRDFPFPKLKASDIYEMPKRHILYVYRI